MADPKQEAVEETVQGNSQINEHCSSGNALESCTTQKDELAEADAVTPLASEQGSLSGGASEPWEDHTDETSPVVQTTDVSKVPPATTTPGKSPIATVTTPTTALPSTQVSHEHASHSYFPIHSLHSQPSKRGLRHTNGSGQSSGSLHTLAETEGLEEDFNQLSVKRSNSTRTRSSSGYIRKHHSKSLSMSHPIANLVKSHVNSVQPVYPEQSLASLSPQPPLVQSPNPVRPVPLRAKSSHPADTLNPHSPSGNRMNIPRFAHTADNTPMGSPGLFTPVTNRTSTPLESTHPRSGSPSLHHLQTPKETHAAEIDVDTISGNKLINTYEVIRELGRGEHGKVKLGRDMETGTYVAIKIVPRWSKQRRLGRLGAPQDQTKREVAILKKARHPNVVSLLEVIDDPNKNKVYLVLEYVEHGEIQWRKLAVYPIAQINNQRFESERKGISLTIEPSEQDRHLVKMAQLRHEGLERNRQNLPHSASTPHYALAYEPHGEDGELLYQTISQAQSIANSSTTSDGPRHGPSRVPSTDDYVSTYPLNGSMYGPYDDSAYRSVDGDRMFARKQSLAALSHMSSEVEFAGGLDYEQSSYVPALTYQEARNAFRDTLLGMEFLHAIGIIHRDIKPSNLLVNSDGTVKISDFGVSYFGQPITEEEAESRNKVQENDAKPLDDERELARSVGTPGFWAPELCYEDPGIFADGKVPKITGAIDMWALGITLYAMIYARLPFQATTEMGLHEAACTAEPVFPKTRLTPVDTSHGEKPTDFGQSINSNKRFDYELKFESVPEDLRDLMSKLLVKDPAYRITIAEAKRHHWVLEGMQDPAQFLKPPEVLEKGSKKKILEVNEKEMSVAVTKRSFVEKMTLATTRIVNNMMKGMTTGRKRATSTSTNTGASNSSESVNTPSGSTTSTVGKIERGRDGRRESLHNLDVVSALQKSRESTKEEHPLAQSQTASPDNQSLAASYFDTPKPMPSPGGSPRVHPQSDARPKLPERAISGVSTAESVKTIRASQVNPHSPLEVTRERDTRLGSDQSLKAKVEGLWEGTTKTFSRLASRDRRSPYASRSPSVSRRSSESEHRGVPSLAISNMQATGSMAPPDVLRAVNQRLEQTSPISSEPSSPTTTTTVETYRPAPTSAPSAFLEAQEINQRRYILEAQQSAEQAALASQAEPTSHESECPPSPDDLTFRRQRSKSMEHPSHPLLDLDVPSRPSISTTVSSLEDIANSSVAQSGSNYSFNATSGASSPPEETFLSAEYKEHYARDLRNDGEPGFMRTADTVTKHGRPRASTTGPALESSNDYYDNDGDDEDDSSDDEGGMIMGGPKKVFR